MGILYVVATPIGNLSDITERAIEVLNNVDIIACEDTRTSSVLLTHFNIKKKLISLHKFNEKTKCLSVINSLKNGLNIALISDAGCPTISDPGSILVHEAIENNIEVISIPGACAFIEALMVSGMDTSSFSFYGFLDRESKKQEEKLQEIKNDASKIIILYESPKRIMKTLEKIDKVLDNPYICLCNDLTKKFEKKYYGKTKEVINSLLDNPQRELGEYVLLIEKENKESIKEDNISYEALIIDEIVKNNLSMKEAIKMVSEKYHYSKNIIYDASLNLKKIFEKK